MLEPFEWEKIKQGLEIMGIEVGNDTNIVKVVLDGNILTIFRSEIIKGIVWTCEEVHEVSYGS